MRLLKIGLLALCLAGTANAGLPGMPFAAPAVPANFIDNPYITGLSLPTAFAWGPGNRIFVAQKGGNSGTQTAAIRLIKNGNLLPTPFMTISVTTEGERGILGVAVDPNYATVGNANYGAIYVYYCHSDTTHNYVSKYFADASLDVRDGTRAEVRLLTANTGAVYHNGGHISIGPDGKLWLGLGDSHTGTGGQAQDKNNLGGKMLRINTDGSIPTDNPLSFDGLGTIPTRTAVWCAGLRNPFSHAWHPTSGRLFINDVGQGTWEEIDDGMIGKNYGWDGGSTDGNATTGSFTGSVAKYQHGVSDPNIGGNVITGGAFYTGVVGSYKFPAGYDNHYYFGDNGGNWISRMDLSNNSIPAAMSGTNYNFHGGAGNPVDLHVGSDGALYYLAHGSGQIKVISYYSANTAIPYTPGISVPPVSLTRTEGVSATFTVTGTGTGTLHYQWQQQTSPPGGAWTNVGTDSNSYTIASPTVTMNGYNYRCIVSNAAPGTATSIPAVLTVNYAAPVINTQPLPQTVTAGQTATFTVAATATGISYQWQLQNPGSATWNNVGTNSATYQITGTTLGQDGSHVRVIVSNGGGGTLTSNSVLLTVNAGASPPAITGQPTNQSVVAPNTATFTVTATGTALSYQWQLQNPGSATWNNAGTNSATYQITNTTGAMDQSHVRVIVSGSGGPSVTSNSVTLTVTGAALAAPTISPPGGTYSGPVTVRITAPAGTIHYTTNNTAPTSGSATYSGPFIVSGNTTVRAIAVPSGAGSNSAEASAVYTISGNTPYGLPFRDPPAGVNIPATEGAIAAAAPTLTATGLFQNPVGNMVPNPGLIPFDVNAPLWSDGARKKRWIALPGNAKITFTATGEWTFPAGTILVKHFDLPTSDVNPSLTKRLETRVFYVNQGGTSYGVTYKWRADNSEADLLTNATVPLDEVQVITTSGGTRNQTWSYPARADCMSCHNSAAGIVLGPKTRQLNGTFAYPGGASDNQLRTWSYLQMFTASLNETLIPGYSKLNRVDDISATLEQCVKSYFDSNCAQCHRPGGPSAPAAWDGRYDTAMGSSNIINGTLYGITMGLTNPRVVVPQDPLDSMMVQRMLSLTPGIRMPRIASHVVDDEAVTTIIAWINSLPVTPGGGGPGVPIQAGCGATGLEVILVLGVAALLRRRRR